MKYEILEHTADIGIRVFGATYRELFNNCVEAFADVILGTSDLSANIQYAIKMESGMPEFLLVDLLSDILLQLETSNVLYFMPELICSDDGRSIHGLIKGAHVTEDMDFRNVIKAVTYHGVTVSPQKGVAEVVFDI